MKLEKAYSRETSNVITATDADTLYLQGIISSKFEFECPDANCDAQVTCANLDKPKDKRKRSPYYIVVSEHSDVCLIGNDIINKNRSQTTSDYGYSDDDVFIENVARINLNPLNNKRSENDKSDSDDCDEAGMVLQNRGKAEGDLTKKQQQRNPNLSSLVSSFLKGDNFEIQFPGSDPVALQSAFIKINGQQINVFDDEMRIYYGKAWINKCSGDTGFSVRFEKGLRYGELSVRPSFFISNQLIEEHSYRKFQKATLEALTTNKLVDFYLLSPSGPYLHKSKKYINFRLEGLQYLEYRGVK